MTSGNGGDNGESCCACESWSLDGEGLPQSAGGDRVDDRIRIGGLGEWERRPSGLGEEGLDTPSDTPPDSPPPPLLGAGEEGLDPMKPDRAGEPGLETTNAGEPGRLRAKSMPGAGDPGRELIPKATPPDVGLPVDCERALEIESLRATRLSGSGELGLENERPARFSNPEPSPGV